MSSSSSASMRRVLRAADVSAVAPADVLEVDLRPAGLRRLDPTRVDEAVAEGRAAGYEAGRQAGMADGRAAAAEQAAAVLSATRARLERLLQSTEAELAASEAHHRASLDQLADRAAELAFAIAEAVVGRELAIAVEPGRDAVARALAAADPGDTEVVVRLNPIDAQGLGTDDLAAGRPIIVVADDAVAPGDCLARVGATTIDARIGAALDRVRAVLVGGTT